ncbi:MAG TPA: hypothetical protein VF691_15600 [Cytophagaceae bacterium]|jgi:3-hydroxyacyl-[acyl-carrier-protein] dehydratase
MNHLLRNFYKIEKIDSQEGTIQASIILDPTHEIYQGHFPETPVVPGVCQMQLTKEIVAETLSKELKIISAQNMKFMAVINPTVNNVLDVRINYQYENGDQIKIDSSIGHGTVTCFKFSGRYQVSV